MGRENIDYCVVEMSCADAVRVREKSRGWEKVMGGGG